MSYHIGMAPARGFTYIEVIVSLFIISVIVALSSAILRTAPLAHHANDEDIALKIAENELEVLRATGYSNLPASGAFTDSLMSTIPNGAGTITVSDFNSGTKQVIVNVSWTDPGTSSTASTTLSTLIGKIGGLQ